MSRILKVTTGSCRGYRLLIYFLMLCCWDYRLAGWILFNYYFMLLEIIPNLPVIDIHITAGVEQPVSVIKIFNNFPLSVSRQQGVFLWWEMQRDDQFLFVKSQNTVFLLKYCATWCVFVLVFQFVCKICNKPARTRYICPFFFNAHIWSLDWLLTLQPHFNPLVAEFYSLVKKRRRIQIKMC